MPTTNFKNSSGTDIGNTLVEKSYLIDRYPELADTFKQAGLWTWGYGGYGNIGDNTTTTRSSPVQTASGGTNWKEISHNGYSALAIKTDGTMWAWGAGYFGVTTDQSGYDTSSPFQVFGAGTTWKQLEVASNHVFAIKTDGTLWAWGYNNIGQLGTGGGGGTRVSSPTQIAGTTWKHIGSHQSSEHTLAIKTDGTLWSWGRGSAYGTLGIGSSGVGQNKNSPVQIAGGGTNWIQASTGYDHSCAIKSDNTLWSWGNENSGQLGIGNTQTPRSTPIQVAGTSWKRVSCGNYHTAAIKTDGTLWAWGQNWYGQLGDGNTTGQYGVNGSPVQTVAGGTNWKMVSCGYYNTMAIKTDGTLWAWGRTSYGTFGDNTNTPKSSPVQIFSGGTNWKQIINKAEMAMAIRDDSADIFGNSL